MPNRTVTGYVEYIDGTPWEGGIVTFELLRPFSTLTETFPRHTEEATCSALGTFTINLAVPDTPATAKYLITLPDGNAYRTYIPDGAAVALHTLLLTAMSYVDPASLQAIKDDIETLVVVNKVADYVILATDNVIRCDGTFNVTLPAATGSNAFYLIINVGVGTITPVVFAGDTINGAVPLTIPTLTSAWYLDGEDGNWDSNW